MGHCGHSSFIGSPEPIANSAACNTTYSSEECKGIINVFSPKELISILLEETLQKKGNGRNRKQRNAKAH